MSVKIHPEGELFESEPTDQGHLDSDYTLLLLLVASPVDIAHNIRIAFKGQA